LIALLLIALSLSFDTFAVSLSCGISQSKIKFNEALKVASVMALFQGLFPFIGYFVGEATSELIDSFDHWIAFIVLGFLGLKMIYDGIKNKIKIRNNISLFSLLGMGIGTSIDALAVGFGISILHANIFISVIIIGVVTFISSMVAIKLGKGFGKRAGPIAEIIGGLILIGLGAKIIL
jgi:putative Mn2+ efflux pump MntP